MPQIVAKLRHLRISPKKVRYLARLVKGMGIVQAESQLQHAHKKASEPLVKLVRSAAANAQHNFQLSKTDLYIRNITVDPGPSLKRWMARAMGRATPILKRTSHVTVVLDTRTAKAKKEKVFKEEAPEIMKAPAHYRETEEHRDAARKEEFKDLKEVKAPKLQASKPKLPSIQKRFFRRKAV